MWEGGKATERLVRNETCKKKEREREIRNVESRMSQPLPCVCVCVSVINSVVSPVGEAAVAQNSN